MKWCGWIVVAGALVVMGGAAEAGRLDDERAALDAKLGQELEAVSAEAAAAWRRAAAADKAGGEAEAEAGAEYRRVRALAPKFAPAARRLCGVELRQGQRAAAIALCREATMLDHSSDNMTALALALLSQDPATRSAPANSDKREAYVLAERAANASPDDFFANMALCQASLAQRREDTLRDCTARLRAIAPEEVATHYFAGIAAAAQGDFGDAEESIEKARARGLPNDVADELLGQIHEAQPWYVRWWSAAWRILVAWLAAALGLLIAGLFLSFAANRAAARTPAEASGRAVGMDAWVRRTYKVVLWLASAYYYLSIPIVLASVVLLGAGLIYSFFFLGRIPIKLVAIIGILVLATAYAVLRSLFVRGVDAEPGRLLDVKAHPRLRAVLDEVAARIGTRPVDNVYLTPDTDLAVTERGTSMWKQLRGVPSERCLILGVGVLEGLPLRGFKAILGHEYGHFQNRDTAGGGFALAVRRSFMTLIFALAQGGVATWWNPAWWFVRAFHFLFFRISQGASRLQEVLCDRWAAFAYGSEAFERGFVHVIDRSTRFSAHLQATLNDVVTNRRPLANLYSYAPPAPLPDDMIEDAVRAEMERAPSAYDSHPAPAERLRLVRALAAKGTDDDKGDADADVWSLFSDRAAIEREMTGEVREAVAANHGVFISADDSPPQSTSLSAP